MQTFRLDKEKAYVDAYAMEYYIPHHMIDKMYRGYKYYELAGTKVKFFGVGNMRFFSSEKEMEDPFSIKVHTLGIPMMLTCEPDTIEVRDIKFTKGGKPRKSVVLTFYRGSVFVDNLNLLQNGNNIMVLMTLIESGKLDNVLPDEAAEIFRDVQVMNKAKLRIPPEEEEIMISERYRDATNHMKKARYHEGKFSSPDEIVSLNMRQEAMKSTTYQAITHEDINTSLISSVNRKRAGIVDEPTPSEAVVRNIPSELDRMTRERDERNAERERVAREKAAENAKDLEVEAKDDKTTEEKQEG